MKKNLKKIIYLAIILTLFSTSTFAKSVTATGMGGSEKTALRDAMRVAVESALGASIDSQTITENYTVIKDRVRLHAEGYVRTYEIVEKIKENGIYRVTIKADVRDDVSSLILSDKEKKAKIRFSLSDPRIAVFAYDKSGAPSYEAQSAFINGLKQIGFSRIVNSKNGADYVVTVKINEYKTGLAGARISLNAKITAVKTNKVILATTEEKSGAGKAGRKRAIRQATEAILDKIDRNAIERATSVQRHITIIITNYSGSLTQLQNELLELPGVNNAYLRRMNGTTAEFDLDYGADATDLAEELERRGVKIKSIDRDIVVI